MPNTTAPDSPLLPTTSEIKLIPVESTMDCEKPMSIAIA